MLAAWGVGSGRGSGGSLSCGAVLVLAEPGFVMPEHPSASLQWHPPREASQTGGSSQGSRGGENFPVGRTGLGGNEAGAGQTAESLILQMLTDSSLTSGSPLNTTFLLPQEAFHSQISAMTIRRSLICLQLCATSPVVP